MLLARAMPGILREMSIDEALDVTRIYSVADALPPEMIVAQGRSAHRIIRLATRAWFAVAAGVMKYQECLSAGWH